MRVHTKQCTLRTALRGIVDELERGNQATLHEEDYLFTTRCLSVREEEEDEEDELTKEEGSGIGYEGILSGAGKGGPCSMFTRSESEHTPLLSCLEYPTFSPLLNNNSCSNKHAYIKTTPNNIDSHWSLFFFPCFFPSLPFTSLLLALVLTSHAPPGVDTNTGFMGSE